MSTAPSPPAQLSDVDWPRWEPKDRATLAFLRRDGEVLLIRKKRGLGAGKVNGPGGRLEPGETDLAAAVREVEEEVGLRPLDLEPRGLLRFQFVDGYSLECRVFVGRRWEGELTVTNEADPFWCSEAALPYDQMWADDVLWLPRLLAGETFEGEFLFDGDRMLGSALRVAERPAAAP